MLIDVVIGCFSDGERGMETLHGLDFPFAAGQVTSLHTSYFLSYSERLIAGNHWARALSVCTPCGGWE
jgi:hypothetical protein